MKKGKKKMRKIVMATTNKNKVKRIRKLLDGLDYNIVPLSDELKNKVEEPEETLVTPVDIAIEKALYYSNYLPDNTLILSQDDTIEFTGISDEDNPGMHIKGPVIKKYGKFTDELAAEYYTSLAEKYGGSIPMRFKYGHALVVKDSHNRKMKKVLGAESYLDVRLVNKIHKLDEVPGYFLAALMEAKINDEWVPYNDLDDETLVKLDSDLYSSITFLLNNINK